MADFSFLKRPEFWITTLISILLTFVGGFLSGKYYYINNEVNMGVENSQLVIQTQDQEGDNLLINQKLPERHINPELINDIKKILEGYKSSGIWVYILNADTETANFGSEIVRYLKSLGFTVYTFDTIQIGGTPPSGISYKLVDENKLTFNIGPRE